MTLESLKDSGIALLTGGLVGFVFGKLKLPVPAPSTIAGILGVLGIALGYWIAKPR